MVPAPPGVEPETDEEKAKGRRRGWSTKEQRLRAIQRGIVTDRGLVNEKGELRPHLLAPMPMMPHFGGHDAAVQRQRMNTCHRVGSADIEARVERRRRRKKRSKKRAVSDMDVPSLWTWVGGRIGGFQAPKAAVGPQERHERHERHGQLSPDNALGAVSSRRWCRRCGRTQGTRVLPPTVYVPGCSRLGKYPCRRVTGRLTR